MANWVNAHWKPIFEQCPLCSLNFSVYAKMENMEEDIQFFKTLAKVEDKNAKIGKSNSGPKLVDAKEFWSKVDMEYVNRLAEPFAYNFDLEMFGYSIQEYLIEIGINYSC